MKTAKTFLIGILFILVLTPLILASWNTGSWGFGYYSSPSYYLENEWVIFSIVFLIFFAVIFYTVNRSFKNPTVSGVIALGLSLFIGLTLAQRGWLYSYAGGEIGAWILVIAIIIAFGFLIKFAYESFGRIGTIASIFIMWALMHGSDPYEVLPSELISNDTIVMIYEFLAGWVGLIFLIIISAIIISARMQRRWHNMGYAMDRSFGR